MASFLPSHIILSQIFLGEGSGKGSPPNQQGDYSLEKEQPYKRCFLFLSFSFSPFADGKTNSIKFQMMNMHHLICWVCQEYI